MTIHKYSPRLVNFCCGHMDESFNGDYALCTEVEGLEEQIATLKAQVDFMEERRQELVKWTKDQSEQIATLTDERDGYRNGQQQMQYIANGLQDTITKYAAERKRLRAALEKIANWNTGHYDDASEMKEVAQEALRGEEEKG